MNKKKSIIIILLIVLFGGLLFGFLYRELNKMEKDNESSKVKEESNYEDLEKQLNEKYALYNKDVIAKLSEYNLTCTYKINADDKSISYKCTNNNNEEIINTKTDLSNEEKLENIIKEVVKQYEINQFLNNFIEMNTKVKDIQNDNSYLTIKVKNVYYQTGNGNQSICFIDKNGKLIGKSKNYNECIEVTESMQYFEDKYKTLFAEELNDENNINLFIPTGKENSCDKIAYYKYSVSNGVLKEELIEEK